MARSYMQQILQYGRALRDGSMKGSEAMAAAKQFSAHIDMLDKMEPQERAHYLEEAFKTELKRQNLRASRRKPERLALASWRSAMPHRRALRVLGSRRSGPFSAERSTGHQLSLPFAERAQLATPPRRCNRAAHAEGELRIIGKEDLHLRSRRQAEPQGQP